MTIDWFNRLAVLMAGILGAGGVAAAAAATHSGGALLAPLSLVALTQAPVLLAIGLSPVKAIPPRIGALVVGIGALLFAADLALRHLAGPSLFPYAAPIGGTAMIIGWVILGLSGLFLRSRPAP
ncbi:MAG: DUF423 domain-containing protein [Rhizobiales bacterium]|nr:DUF423 domain-containing protein [Hyphomicrobiales bacterium]